MQFQTEKIIRKKLKITDNMLSKLHKKSSDKKLNRSYALIEFENYEAKVKALSTDFRVFGILLDDTICNIEDADYKLTLICNNIHWGSSLY
jgi:hypothetical protein